MKMIAVASQDHDDYTVPGAKSMYFDGDE